MFKKKIRKLESEIESLKIEIAEKSNLIIELESKNANLQSAIFKSDSVDESNAIAASVRFDNIVKSTKLREFKDSYFKSNKICYKDTAIMLKVLQDFNQFLKDNKYSIRKS